MLWQGSAKGCCGGSLWLHHVHIFVPAIKGRRTLKATAQWRVSPCYLYTEHGTHGGAYLKTTYMVLNENAAGRSTMGATIAKLVASVSTSKACVRTKAA